MAELIRLTKENMGQLSSSKVSLICCGQNYLQEMRDELGTEFVDSCERYAELEDISAFEPDTKYVIADDYYKEIYDDLVDIITSDADIYFYANKETSYDLAYREKYIEEPLRDIIIFRSGPHASAYIKGTDFADNARAVFEYMLSVRLNQKYELVWLVKNPADYEHVAKANENVRFISFDWSVVDDEKKRDAYYEALCLAKYIFFTDAYGFCRNARQDQIRVQLWHGCGFKTRVNFVRCEHRYEYMPVISSVYKDIHKRIYGLRDDQVLVTGYPKEDTIFHPRSNWKEVLGIKDASKYIFWLPTFRKTDVANLSDVDMYKLSGETGLPVVKTAEDLNRLDKYLQAHDMVLILKLHPFQDSSLIKISDCSNIIFLDNEKLIENDIQINEILEYADALISDYSSVAIDYLVLDRPIAFKIEDIEEYESARGFVFEPIRDWLPGMEILAFEDFMKFVIDISEDVDATKEKRQIIRKKLHSFCDDRSCERLVEMLGIR